MNLIPEIDSPVEVLKISKQFLSLLSCWLQPSPLEISSHLTSEECMNMKLKIIKKEGITAELWPENIQSATQNPQINHQQTNPIAIPRNPSMECNILLQMIGNHQQLWEKGKWFRVLLHVENRLGWWCFRVGMCKGGHAVDAWKGKKSRYWHASAG